MAWFGKSEGKKEKLPELPPITLPTPPERKIPEIPGMFDKKEVSSLPSFPPSRTGERMSRETIKHSVSRQDEEGEEMETPRWPHFEEERPRSFISEAMPMAREEKGPIFIRIDKFQDILKALDEAKNKVEEISNSLEHVKSQKEKEEAQIIEWEREILATKERLDRIDKVMSKKLM